eukprot:191167_1
MLAASVPLVVDLNLAFVHENKSVEHFYDLLLWLLDGADDGDGLLRGSHHGGEMADEVAGSAGVESRGGLVETQNARLHRHLAGDGQTTHLTTAEGVGGVVVLLRAEAQHRELRLGVGGGLLL